MREKREGSCILCGVEIGEVRYVEVCQKCLTERDGRHFSIVPVSCDNEKACEGYDQQGLPFN
ncbi:hypothetical protein JW899_03465 [Candidatus Uhrbacteria bacterium]|nr:hypothetical protein [Candidatus Uhrbacteria bacterium]